jgi:tetratricopeptide (TPR) repeat protein
MSLVGTVAGSIRIVDRLGAGGMGEVYLGVDERLGRRVAVKTIRRERQASASARARFLREAQILSQLEHPSICRIYEYIEADERDLIVLELVQGADLEQAQRDGLSEREKLAIAEQIAAALVAAHSLSVVHRDLKPENVIITPSGETKVLDFGLARFARTTELQASGPDAISGAGLDPGPLTVTADGGVMGTPRYMSPEQARGEEVTAASDMYSFGLVLQELFTGTSPYAGVAADVLPNKIMWGETLPVTGVDRDLAALIGRLKELQPSQRPSAEATAERLAWIRDRPRRRLRQLATALVAASLVLAAVLSSVGLIQARRSLHREQQARREAEAVSSFLETMLASADPGEAGIDVRVIDVLDQAAARVDRSLAEHPVERAAALHTLGTTYKALGAYQPARESLQRAHRIRRRELGPDHPSSLETLDRLAIVVAAQGQYGEAVTLHRQALEHRSRVLGDDHEDTMSSCDHLASALNKVGRYEEAEALHRRMLAWSVAERGARHPDTLSCQNNLATVLERRGKLTEALELHRTVLDARLQVLGREHPQTLSSTGNLAIVLAKTGEDEEAEQLFRRTLELKTGVLGPTHPETLAAMGNLGAMLSRREKYAEAVELQRRTLAAMEQALGRDHPRTLAAVGNLARALAGLGELDEAERLFRDAWTRLSTAVGPSHLSTLGTLNGLANVLQLGGELAEAERLQRDCLRLHRQTLGDEHPSTLGTAANLASILEDLGRRDAAAALTRESLAVAGRTLGPDHSLTERLRRLQASLEGSS